VCNLSAERKRALTKIWALLQEFMRLCADQRSWITTTEELLKEANDATACVAQSDLPGLQSKLEVRSRSHVKLA